MMPIEILDPPLPKIEGLGRLEQELLKRVDSFEFPRLLLEAMGIRQNDLVRKYGFRKAEVSECLRGMSRHRKIRNAVAEELGVRVEEIWPK